MTKDNDFIVFFDLETTGLDIKSDRIIQIGMIKTDKDLNIIDAVEQKINPDGVKSRPEALEKHKIPDEELLKYPKFSEIADDILEFVKGCDLGGHNCIKFDIPFLMEEMNRCGKAFTVEKRRIIDTYVMYKNYNKTTLSDIYKEYCSDNNNLDCDAHDAICDAQMCVEVYKAILAKHNPSQSELDDMNHNNTRIDLSGFFVFNENMRVCMGKGKYNGVEIEKVDPGYLEWMTKQDLPIETINLAKRCLVYLSKRTHQNS